MRKIDLGALVLAFLSTPALAQSGTPTPIVSPNETILRVSGEGSVEIAPEIARISIGVTTTGATAMEALSKNNQDSSRLVKAIREAGIAGRDVQTSDLSVEPEYAEDDEEDRIIGWRAINSLTVTTADLENLGDLITVLFDAGGNTANAPDFDLTEASKLRALRDAERKALAEARDQAEATAAALGMRVARTLLVSDSKVNFSGGGRYIVVTGSRMSRPAVPIEPGMIEVQAEYSVEYALVPL